MKPFMKSESLIGPSLYYGGAYLTRSMGEKRGLPDTGHLPAWWKRKTWDDVLVDFWDDLTGSGVHQPTIQR